MLRKLKWAALAAILAALSGCATDGEREYESTGRNNLHIQSSLEDAHGRGVFLYVYDVDAKCERNYLGYIRLEEDKPSLDYGLPPGKLLVLTAEFVSTYGGSQSRNAVEYLVQPGPGLEYYADVRFKGSMYKFTVSEARNGGPRRALDHGPRGGCAFKG